VARLTQAEPAFAAPFAQHALSPANALDAISIATATKVVVILIMVNAETGAMQELFNLYSSMIGPFHSNFRMEKAYGEGEPSLNCLVVTPR
jgi:hypothetical protein